MHLRNILVALLAALLLALCVTSRAASQGTITLPQPRLQSDVSVEAAIGARRSVRTFAPGALRLAEVSQLLWAAQGITDRERGHRTVPSAGARYPLELYAVVAQVEGASPGVYRYQADTHQLVLVAAGDRRAALAAAASGQASVAHAALVLAVVADYARIRPRYGDRSERYTAIEAGGVMENVYLQARALGLGTVAVGAFRDAETQAVIGCDVARPVLLLLPIGRL